MKIILRNAATLQRHGSHTRAGARMRHIYISRCIVAERHNNKHFSGLASNGERNGETGTVAGAEYARSINSLARNGGKNRIKYAGKWPGGAA